MLIFHSFTLISNVYVGAGAEASGLRAGNHSSVMCMAVTCLPVIASMLKRHPYAAWASIFYQIMCVYNFRLGS